MGQRKITTIATGTSLTMFFIAMIPMAYWREINLWLPLAIAGATWGLTFTIGMVFFHQEYIEPIIEEVEVEVPRYVEVPSDYPIPEHIILLYEAFRKGEIENVSLRQLDSAGISRFKERPNATTVKEWLEGKGYITREGDWTGTGRSFFTPAPKEQPGTEERAYQRATPARTTPTPATPA